jgi:hypothetical protein
MPPPVVAQLTVSSLNSSRHSLRLSSSSAFALCTKHGTQGYIEFWPSPRAGCTHTIVSAITWLGTGGSSAALSAQEYIPCRSADEGTCAEGKNCWFAIFKEGWRLICGFLDGHVPDAPSPRVERFEADAAIYLFLQVHSARMWTLYANGLVGAIYWFLWWV